MLDLPVEVGNYILNFKACKARKMGDYQYVNYLTFIAFNVIVNFQKENYDYKSN